MVVYFMRTQIAFKQFNPNKPAKYGMLFKSVNAARYPFAFITSVYGPFYISGSDAIVMHLVKGSSSQQIFVGGISRTIVYIPPYL